MIDLPLPNWMRSGECADESCAGLLFLQTQIHISLRHLFKALAPCDSLLTESEKLALAKLLDESHVSSHIYILHAALSEQLTLFLIKTAASFGSQMWKKDFLHRNSQRDVSEHASQRRNQVHQATCKGHSVNTDGCVCQTSMESTNLFRHVYFCFSILQWKEASISRPTLP